VSLSHNLEMSVGWWSRGLNSRSKQASKGQQRLQAAAAAAAVGLVAGLQVLDLQQGSVLVARLVLVARQGWEG
jgi:hypothetical protein